MLLWGYWLDFFNWGRNRMLGGFFAAWQWKGQLRHVLTFCRRPNRVVEQVLFKC